VKSNSKFLVLAIAFALMLFVGVPKRLLAHPAAQAQQGPKEGPDLNSERDEGPNLDDREGINDERDEDRDMDKEDVDNDAAGVHNDGAFHDGAFHDGDFNEDRIEDQKEDMHEDVPEPPVGF